MVGNETREAGKKKKRTRKKKHMKKTDATFVLIIFLIIPCSLRGPQENKANDISPVVRSNDSSTINVGNIGMLIELWKYYTLFF